MVSPQVTNINLVYNTWFSFLEVFEGTITKIQTTLKQKSTQFIIVQLSEFSQTKIPM